MKRILVPLDGTKKAEAALTKVEELFTPEDAITLLMVEKPVAPQRAGYRAAPVVGEGVVTPVGVVANVSAPDIPVYAESSDQAIQRQVDEALDYLEEMAAPLREKGFIVKTEALIEEHADHAIIDYARSMKPDLIAMVRRTHSGVAELIFGSVAAAVARSDVAPVLLVPAA